MKFLKWVAPACPLWPLGFVESPLASSWPNYGVSESNLGEIVARHFRNVAINSISTLILKDCGEIYIYGHHMMTSEIQNRAQKYHDVLKHAMYSNTTGCSNMIVSSKTVAINLHIPNTK